MQRCKARSVFAACFVVVGFVWSGGTALAQEGQVYLGVGPGFGFENFDGVPGGIDIDEAFGFDAWAGYRIAPFVAAEVQLEYLNGFDLTAPGFGDIDIQAVAFTGNAKLFPLAEVSGDRVEPFLLTGIGVGWFEFDTSIGTGDDADFIARFGGGIDLYVTENVAFQVSSSYVLTTGDVKDLDYVSLVAGLQYRF